MKIKVKKNVKAAEAIECPVAEEVVEVAAVPAESTLCKYNDAICAIQSAIEFLAADAKEGDEVAKANIANLSVVLLDLKGSC